MSTFNLELLFFDEGFMGEPTANVHVKSSTGQQFGGIQYDRLISCDCLSPSEFNSEIDRLHAELEKVRQDGKKNFARAKSAIRAVPSSGFRSSPSRAS